MNLARRRLIALATAMVGASAAYACGNSPSNPTVRESAQSRQTRVPREYLVTLTPRTEVNAITVVYGRFGIKGIKALGNNVFLVTLTEDPGLGAMEKLREGNAHIKAIQPNYIYGTQRSGPG